VEEAVSSELVSEAKFPGKYREFSELCSKQTQTQAASAGNSPVLAELCSRRM
jgi:hypothetical protein